MMMTALQIWSETGTSGGDSPDTADTSSFHEDHHNSRNGHSSIAEPGNNDKSILSSTPRETRNAHVSEIDFVLDFSTDDGVRPSNAELFFGSPHAAGDDKMPLPTPVVKPQQFAMGRVTARRFTNNSTEIAKKLVHIIKSYSKTVDGVTVASIPHIYHQEYGSMQELIKVHSYLLWKEDSFPEVLLDWLEKQQLPDVSYNLSRGPSGKRRHKIAVITTDSTTEQTYESSQNVRGSSVPSTTTAYGFINTDANLDMDDSDKDCKPPTGSTSDEGNTGVVLLPLPEGNGRSSSAQDYDENVDDMITPDVMEGEVEDARRIVGLIKRYGKDNKLLYDMIPELYKNDFDTPMKLKWKNGQDASKIQDRLEILLPDTKFQLSHPKKPKKRTIGIVLDGSKPDSLTLFEATNILHEDAKDAFALAVLKKYVEQQQERISTTIPIDVSSWLVKKIEIIEAKENAFSATGSDYYTQHPKLRRIAQLKSKLVWKTLQSLWTKYGCLSGSKKKGYTFGFERAKYILESYDTMMNKFMKLGGVQAHSLCTKMNHSASLSDTNNTEHSANFINGFPSTITLTKTASQWTGDQVHDMLQSRQQVEDSVLKDPALAALLENASRISKSIFHIALHIETTSTGAAFLGIATGQRQWVVDLRVVKFSEVFSAMRPVFDSPDIIKVIHDIYTLSMLPQNVEDKIRPANGMFDTQLAMEMLHGTLDTSITDLFQHFYPGHVEPHNKMQGFNQSTRAVVYASRLLRMREEIEKEFGGAESFQTILHATAARSIADKKEVSFHISDMSYRLGSVELIEAMRRSEDRILETSPLIVHNDVEELLRLLPLNLSSEIRKIGTERLSDIVLDLGREPICWISNKRHVMISLQEVTEMLLCNIVAKMPGGGSFGDDNRAGLERQLHRISCMRNRSGDVIGLTLRVGRHVDGNADMISDLLFGTEHKEKSILFLGEPGSGKTTVIREVARMLSEENNVCVVDTSNEIAGDGNIPHPCIGYSRRMMVPSLGLQGEVMIECVQNHTPSVMVVDEIGRPTEVEAARTCKQRGIRMIASAHGDLRKLVRNPALRSLIGGVNVVTLGDAAAKQEAKRFSGGQHIVNASLSKLKPQRAGPPVFEVIVELCRGAHDEWSVVVDSGRAVDAILEGENYEAQQRRRAASSGRFEITRNFL